MSGWSERGPGQVGMSGWWRDGGHKEVWDE